MVLVVATLILSYVIGDGQTGTIMMASTRATIQLMVLGQILLPIFQYGHTHWWAPVVYILAMGLIAAHAALGRPKYEYPGISWHFLVGVGTVPVVIAFIIVGAVLRVKPLWEPQYCIPLAGMIFNNAITGISLGVNSLVTELKEGRDRIELLVSMGGSRWEVCKGLVKTASVVANTPTINTLSVVGLVSIPGMMTGQIIGGNSPQAAAGYQLIVMFMILSSNAFAVVICCYLALLTLVSPDGMLYTDKITKRATLPSVSLFSRSRFKSISRAIRNMCCCWRGVRGGGIGGGAGRGSGGGGDTSGITAWGRGGERGNDIREPFIV